MSIEEKSRAYDEALERAKSFQEKYGGGCAEYIFPELSESEDERIKKIITDSVFYQYGAGVEYKDVLDYLDKLEKQKENPKTADPIPSNCTSYAKCEDRDSEYGVFPEDAIVVARACEKLEAHGYLELAHALINVNLYTKEQKPVEWRPSDEQIKAMGYFVRKHQATANHATTTWPEFEAFKSLYQDLKKL